MHPIGPPAETWSGALRNTLTLVRGLREAVARAFCVPADVLRMTCAFERQLASLDHLAGFPRGATRPSNEAKKQEPDMPDQEMSLAQWIEHLREGQPNHRVCKEFDEQLARLRSITARALPVGARVRDGSDHYPYEPGQESFTRGTVSELDLSANLVVVVWDDEVVQEYELELAAKIVQPEPEPEGQLVVGEDPDGQKLRQAVEDCCKAAQLDTAPARDAIALSLVLRHVLLPWVEFAEQSRARHLGWCTGTVHAPEILMLRQFAGEGRDAKSGCSYELSVLPGGMPHVKSGQSGRHWTASWDDLVRLALAAGVDEEQFYQAPAVVPPGALSEAALAKGLAGGRHRYRPSDGRTMACCTQAEGDQVHEPKVVAQVAPPEGLTLRPDPAVSGAIGVAPAAAPPHPFPESKDAADPQRPGGEGGGGA